MTKQWVPLPLEVVFRFFCTPENLLKITPPEGHTRMLELSVMPIPGHDPSLAGPGTELHLRYRPIPFLRMERSWRERIVEVEWLSYFRDIQISGPFRRFDHLHRFKAESRNGRIGTIIDDTVEYELGILEPLGSVAARLMLWRLFQYRHRATMALLVGDE